MACRLAGLSRSAWRRPLNHDTVADPDQPLRAWLCQYAKDHPRWGYRRAYLDARADGWHVNHKKIQRLWCEEGLRVPQRRRRKRVGSSTIEAPAAYAPNVVWAVDFQFDVCEQGKAFKICSIVDDTPANASADWSSDPSPQTASSTTWKNSSSNEALRSCCAVTTDPSSSPKR